MPLPFPSRFVLPRSLRARPRHRRRYQLLAVVVLGTLAWFALVGVALSQLRDSCTAGWYEADGTPIAGPGACPVLPYGPGGIPRGYAEVGGRVFALAKRDDVFGVHVDFIALPRQVSMGQLRVRAGDLYAEDSRRQFYRNLPLPILAPPVELARLRAVDGGSLFGYVTDGRYLLFGARVVADADMPSVQALHVAGWSGPAKPPPSPFARDRHGVIFAGQRLRDVDAARFHVVYRHAAASPVMLATDGTRTWRVDGELLVPLYGDEVPADLSAERTFPTR